MRSLIWEENGGVSTSVPSERVHIFSWVGICAGNSNQIGMYAYGYQVSPNQCVISWEQVGPKGTNIFTITRRSFLIPSRKNNLASWCYPTSQSCNIERLGLVYPVQKRRWREEECIRNIGILYRESEQRSMNMSKRFALISNSILSIHRDRLYPAAINFYNCDKYFRVQSWEVNRKKHTSKRKKMSDIE